MSVLNILRKDNTRRFSIVLSLAILVGSAWMAMSTIEAFKQIASDTDAIQSRIYLTSKMVGKLVDMETGQRGYVLTGDKEFLDPYHAASDDVGILINELKPLYQDEPDSAPALDDISALASQKIVFLNKTIALRSSGHPEEASELIASGEGKRIMDDIRDIVSRLEATDRTHITQHFQLTEELSRRTLVTVLLGFAIGTSILFAVFVLFDREVLARRAAMEALTDSRDELQRSNEELEHFAYVASHDLQEPLRKIASFAQLLERKYKQNLDETGVRYIGYLVDGAQRMSDLINDLLMYSRVGRKGKPFAPVDLDAAVARVRDSLSMAIQDAGATIDVDPLPTLEGDGSQLSQVFQNLMANALKFRSKEPPLVQVKCREEADRWVFTVRDNGIGIAPEHQAVIFRMFQRLHTREEYPGTGIGLALCKRIVNRHGGDIWVESPAEGGSAFHFTISKSLKGKN